MGQIVGLDANVFIYTLEGHPVFGQAASQLLRAVANGSVKTTASELVYLEVLSGKNIETADQELHAQTFLAGIGMAYHPIDRQLLIKAAGLRRKHGLRSPDAIHLASAVATGATYFVTNDHGLLKKSVPGLRIVSLERVYAEILQPLSIS